MLFLPLATPCFATPWKAGVAERDITPAEPIWMAGYAAREKPSQGVAQPIFAKALALQDSEGELSLIMTLDVLGFSAEFIETVVEGISGTQGIDRSRILFNASHTHSSPALSGVLEIAYRMTPEQRADVDRYSVDLQKRLVALAGAAVTDLEPARLSFGKSSTDFAVNRRVPTESGYVIGAYRVGPVDHSVPFIAVDTERGRLKAVVFGYSCHNTTLQGSNYFLHGDYAGVAQEQLQERFPEAVALFVTGTAGDANPYPRGTRQLAEEHGARLGTAVSGAITGPLEALEGPLHARFEKVELPFDAPPDRAELTARLQDENEFVRRHAQYFLSILDRDGAVPASYAYPLQVWKFGEQLTLVAMAGEVVVDYGIRLREEISGEVWVAGYSNDVFAYIPSARILDEGGYEAEDSMIYYGQPGRFSGSVEESIVGKVHEMIERLNREGSLP